MALIGHLAEALRTREDDFRCVHTFNRWARRVHAFQRATNPTLCAYWDRVATSDSQATDEPEAWHAIPPVPVAAFKDLAIASAPAEIVFRTSGTTGGASGRGEHHVASLDLYRAAARNNYRRHLFAGEPPGASTVPPGPPSATPSRAPAVTGPTRLALVSLVPHPPLAPDSSLSAMAGFIAQEPEVDQITWAFHPRHGLDLGAVTQAVAAASGPVLLLTTAFALVHLLDALDRTRLPLPAGSRIMETGGFKGRVAEVDRATLCARVRDRLGVPESHVVNEYGMTEMLSQAYDAVAGFAPPPAERHHHFPPWVRTRALDPATLAPLPPGEPGLLAHFDLANAASVCHILTEDYGYTTTHGDHAIKPGGLRLLGRAPGATLRGCSLTAESFLRLTRRGT